MATMVGAKSNMATRPRTSANKHESNGLTFLYTGRWIFSSLRLVVAGNGCIAICSSPSTRNPTILATIAGGAHTNGESSMAASKAASATSPSAAGPWPVQGAARGGGTPAGGRAAGHRSGGRARRPRWRLWRLLARRPPATHAGDGEGGGGAPESCGGAPKGRCGQRRGRERRCRAGRSASAADSIR